MNTLLKKLFLFSLIAVSPSIFAQTSKWSLEAGAGAGYYANIGVLGLKYNNTVDYRINKIFSISGGLGFYESLQDFQNTPGVNNTLSMMLVDGNLNLCLFKSKQINSLWYGIGVSYFKGAELMENSYAVATRVEASNINTMGINMKLKYKHKISDRLSGAVNLESYSMNSFFDPNNLVINAGYSVSYNF